MCIDVTLRNNMAKVFLLHTTNNTIRQPCWTTGAQGSDIVVSWYELLSRKVLKHRVCE